MPILHMETDIVRGVGNQLQQTADLLSEHTQQFNTTIQTLSSHWQGPSAEIFISDIHPILHQLNQLFDTGTTLNHRLQREVDEWEQVDNQRGLNSLLDSIFAGTIPAIAILTQGDNTKGSVLGANTVSSSTDFEPLPWSEKFAKLEELEREIASQEQNLNGQSSFDEAEERIKAIDEQVAELEVEKQQAQAEANKWYNKVLPDWPLTTDDDGVPWRVKADNSEDEIARSERSIENLRQSREDLVNLQQQHQTLNSLKEQRNSLDALISEGIPQDGPADKYPYFPGQIDTNCTKYASQKRYFPQNVSGNAYEWPVQAKEAGYEVGSYPVKGSVVAFQPGIKGAHAQYGHVAIVEEVRQLDDGTYEVLYSDNHHVPPKPPAKLKYTQGDSGISFIYDQQR
ncbi:MAG: CHAP domain-containing protein [Chloroflexi bacterium]|nr:CHAP domain-containing protein [Chloroflexota bacterium]MBP8058644.1 CHAP domain-containing protein [Chloroflexota bacterium]